MAIKRVLLLTETVAGGIKMRDRGWWYKDEGIALASRGRGFNSWPFRSWLMTLGKLFTHTCFIFLLFTVVAGDTLTYRQWANLIKENFEKHFWVDTNPSAPDARPDLINRRGIYKDTVGASAPWTDYQLRPNFPIALAVVRVSLLYSVARI